MAREKIAPIQNQYIHLAGTTHDRPAGVPRLYLGPNHLLIMQLKSQRETARRFYYSDITALRCEPTWWGYFVDGIFLAIAAFLWIVYLTMQSAEVGTQVAAVTASVIAGIVLIANWLRGPTCRTWLHTHNHTERLTSLGRYNTARHALTKLHERIVEAQEAQYGEHVDADRSFAPYAPPTALEQEIPRRRHDTRLMKGAFFVSLFSVLLGCLHYLYDNSVLDTVELWTSLACAGLGTAAIIRSYGTDCPPLARKMCACLLASTTLSVPITLAAMALLALLGIDAASFQSIRDLDPSDGLQFFVVVGIHTCMILFDATCVLIGLGAMFRQSD